MTKELLPENEGPLNQLSKKALKSLKVKSEPEDLYVLQLMSWVLRERKGQFNQQNYPDLLDAVEYLERQEAKVVLLLSMATGTTYLIVTKTPCNQLDGLQEND